MGLMSNEEAKIAAWVMACEGCFSVYRSTRKKLNRTDWLELKPVIDVSNTDLELLLHFQYLTSKGRVREQSGNSINGHKKQYHWFIRDMKNCYEFCCEILSYMPAKKEQVELMIDFCRRSWKVSGVKSRDLDADWNIFYRMKELNKRGAN